MHICRSLTVLFILFAVTLVSCGNGAGTKPEGGPGSNASIMITPTTPSLEKGTTQQFTATAIYSDNTTQDVTTLVTWSSSSTAVATISNDADTKGRVSAVAVGTTTISATSDSISGSAVISNATVLTVAPNQMGGSLQGKNLELTTAVTTLAGVAPGSTDGTGTAARFFYPSGVTSDGTNLYSIDANGSIRKIVIATGEVTTLGGTPVTPGLNQGGNLSWYYIPPHGITTIGTNLYVASFFNIIQKVDLTTGMTTTLAGSMGMQGTADGTGPDARFWYPTGITNDGTNLYVTDKGNNRLRKIVIATGEVTTLANDGTWGSSGTLTAATLGSPTGITINTDKTNLFVVEYDKNIISRVVISTGAVSTVAGTSWMSGATDGTGSDARFMWPTGITADNANLYVADSGNRTIRKIVISTGEVTTLAGTVGTIGSLDGIGTQAQFANPFGMYSDGTNLYVSDKGNCTIRKIVISTGEVSTVAGTSTQGSSDGVGAAARFFEPEGITTDGSSLYVADYKNHIIREIITATGQVITLAGSAGQSGSSDAIGASARFNNPVGITTDGANLYVADTGNNTIRKIVIASGDVTTLAGTALSSGSTDSTGTNARFNSPAGITTDGINLYISDMGNHTIRKVVIATAEVTTLAGSASFSGTIDATGADARFNYPYGITTDGTNLYIADWGNHSIRKIVIASGDVSTLAGVTGTLGYAEGVGSSARFSSPSGITTDGSSLYIADSGNALVRKLTLSTNEVTTLAGTLYYEGAQDGTGASAMFNVPRGITTDGISLYIADSYNNTIRKIQ